MLPPTPHPPQSVIETLRGLSPSVVRQVVPLVEQLAPMYLDVAQVRSERAVVCGGSG